MMAKVLVSAVLGLTLLSSCASETPPSGPRTGMFPARPQPMIPTPTTPGLGGTAGRPGPALPGNFGSNPDGLMSIAGTAALPTSPDGTPKAENCGMTDINTGRVQPTVWLVIDGSGSMADPLVGLATPGAVAVAGASRWDALRPALMDPNGGVVPTLEKLVKFGMVMYDGPLNGVAGTTLLLPDGGIPTGMPPTTECPRLVTVEPALNNFAALDPMIPKLPPGGSTPTHRALQQVLSHLPANVQVPDGMVQPTYVVLATDGAPNDFCSADPFAGFPGNMQYQTEVVNLTKQMAAQQIPVYVISLASSDAALASHLEQVAAAGGTNTPPFEPQSKQQLVDTFMQIIGPEVLCTVKLTSGFGVMPDNACMGKVMLNGEELPCNNDNGWKLTDSKTIEVTGTACEKFKKENNSRLTANFPCAIQVPG